MQLISGNRVRLRQAVPEDRRQVFEWLARSDVTSWMMGPPTFPEEPVVTFKQFCDDYGPHFFDGSSPDKEASFIIEVHGDAVGHVNYEITHRRERFAELDIWMRSGRYTARGYGPDALRTLVDHLRTSYGIDTFVIRPSARNPRAIRAYEKSGFQRSDMTREEETERFGAPDYSDSVVMILRI